MYFILLGNGFIVFFSVAEIVYVGIASDGLQQLHR